MPSHSKAAEIKLPAAEALADLYSIRQDLDAAIRFCELTHEHFDAHEYKGVETQEGLAIAAVVSYARCFVDGLREWQPAEELEGLTEADLANHEFFMKLRHRCVAHSVSVFAEAWVTATVTVRDGVRLPITSLGSGGNRRVIGAYEAGRLLPLATAVRAAIDRCIAEESPKLLAKLQEIPLDEIHELDLRPGYAPKDSDVGKRRERHSQPRRRARKRK